MIRAKGTIRSQNSSTKESDKKLPIISINDVLLAKKLVWQNNKSYTPEREKFCAQVIIAKIRTYSKNFFFKGSNIFLTTLNGEVLPRKNDYIISHIDSSKNWTQRQPQKTLKLFFFFSIQYYFLHSVLKFGKNCISVKLQFRHLCQEGAILLPPS